MRSVKLAVSVVLAVSLAVVVPAQAGGKGKDNASTASSGNSGNGNSGNGNGNSGNGNSGNTGGGPAVATPLALCALSDLSVASSACGGFFQGNLLNNSPSDVTAQTSALAALGLTAWDGSIAEPQLSLSSASVNFSTALYGLTYVGIHFGAGVASPSPHTPGGVTGFYRFDAGPNLDVFNLAFGSGSAARLYLTQAAPAPLVVARLGPPVIPSAPELPLGSPPPPPQLPIDIPLPFAPPAQSALTAVPEPATWLMMILGFAGVGTILRSRRKSVPARF